MTQQQHEDSQLIPSNNENRNDEAEISETAELGDQYREWPHTDIKAQDAINKLIHVDEENDVDQIIGFQSEVNELVTHIQTTLKTELTDRFQIHGERLIDG